MEADTVPLREFEVTTRVAGADVADVAYRPPGLIVESLLGRYVLDRDARTVWMRVDGRRTAREIADAVATATGRDQDVDDPVFEVLDRLLELGLIRV